MRSKETIDLMVLRDCAIRLSDGAQLTPMPKGTTIHVGTFNGRHAYEDLVQAGYLLDVNAEAIKQ